MDSVSLALLGQDWALWIAFLFSLLLCTLLAGNPAPAKFAQYLLVGVSLGYLGVLLVQHVLRPRLFTPLWEAPLAQWHLWLGLLLGLLLWVAAAGQVWVRPRPGVPSSQHRQNSYTFLQLIGVIPTALMLGVSVSAVVVGLLQGSFWPLFWSTARSGFVGSTSLTESLVSVLVLLLTTAALLHWTMPASQLTAHQLTGHQPRWLQHLLAWWGGLGKRALWFAAGVIFARLLAAHLSLLIARFQFLLLTFEKSWLWQGADRIWQLLAGGA